MVLDRIVGTKEVLKDPIKAFSLGIVISLISLFVAYSVFPQSTGLFTVIIITLASLPLMNRLLRYEEHEDEKMMETHTFFQRYGDIILAYIALFSGMIIAMSLSFVVLPETFVEKVFSDQINEVNLIRGKFEFGNKFVEILANNSSVLTLSFLFSFLFGSGAIFILAWNASVLSSAIGLIAKSSGGLIALPSAVMMFIPHGSFEIGAYFIGAIAGGLVSAAVTRRKSVKFWHVVQDSMKLLALAFILLIIGGIIETMIIMI
jgi:uncharacterized membrane protein SpoIIM required for sporulation